MPRNGSGEYNLPSNTWNPMVAGQIADASDGNQTLDDLASALTTSIATDGQSIVTQNIPFGGFQLIEVGGVRVSTQTTAATVYALKPTGTGQDDGIWFSTGGNTEIRYDGSAAVRVQSAGATIFAGRGTNRGLRFQGSAVTGLIYDTPSSFVLSEVGLYREGTPFLRCDGTRVYINTITNDSGATPLGMTANGVYRITSTKRGKAEITPLKASTALFKTLSPVSFFARDENGQTKTGRRFSGFLAEDVHAAKAGLANVGTDQKPESLDSNGLIAELWAMVQELLGRVEKLEARP